MRFNMNEITTKAFHMLGYLDIFCATSKRTLVSLRFGWVFRLQALSGALEAAIWI